MDTVTRKRQIDIKARSYPNAAEPSVLWQRFIDTALCVASGVGIVVVLFFLLTM